MTIQGQVENAESAETEVQKQKYDSEKKKLPIVCSAFVIHDCAL